MIVRRFDAKRQCLRVLVAYMALSAAFVTPYGAGSLFAQEEGEKPAEPAAASPVAIPGSAAPAPAAAGGEAPAPSALVTIAMNDGRIESAAAVLSSQAGGSVTIFGKAANTRVTVIAEDQPIDSVLNSIANPGGFVWWRDDNGDYGIGDRDYYEKNILPGRVIQKVFLPKNIKASELDKAIKGMMTPNVGSSVADDRTNKLIVNDLPQALERIERFIREIDVQLVIRVFYIRHADVEDIAKKIESYKSGPGTIEVDTRTHLIVVSDLLANIKKMELLIDILDVGPEIVIYDVNNIGIEGEDLEDLKAVIDKIRTKDDRLLFEVNEKQGSFILEDVPEVHERVEQLLDGLDQPVKQVLIQGEILSTAFTRNFNFGLTQFQWSSDLLAARSQGAVGAGQFPNGGTTTGGTAAPPSYTDLDRIFPNIGLAGDTLTGNYLSQTVLFQYQAVFNDSSTRVLLQPRVLVKNQQESRIFVGSETPFLTTFFDDTTNNTSSSRRTSTQSTVTSGLTFEVTPSITNSYLIELQLSIDNDEAKPEDIPDGTSTTRVVGRDRQQVETTLQIPSGQSRMIGGLIRNSNSDGSSGLPFLASLPWIGSLFGAKTSAKTATNLMIFITPSIVEDVLPRATSVDGRRGRLVTDYKRVPGEFDLGLEDAPATGEESPISAPSSAEDLLSGDARVEQEHMEAFEDSKRRRNEALTEGDTAGNYTPSIGTGSATLNSAGAPAAGGTAPPRVPPPQPNTGQQPVPVEVPQRTAPGAPQPPADGGAAPAETTYR